MRNSTHLSQTAVVFIISVALVTLARSEDTDLSIHIDHVMLGASNLEYWTVGGPNPDLLTRLQKVLGLSFDIYKSPKEQFTLSVSCPKGKVVFGPPVQPQ